METNINYCCVLTVPLQSVATPDKLAGLRGSSDQASSEGRDYRLLWQNAIKQQIMLGKTLLVRSV